jgi:hypothetical protein
VEYDIFFSGGRKLPPTNLRFKVDALVKRLMEEQMSSIQKFKYNQLVAKYSLYRDLWRRNLKEMEEGGVLRSERDIEKLLHRERSGSEPQEVPADQLTTVIRDPVAETPKIEELYRNLQKMRAHFGEKPLELNLEQFVRLVQLKSTEISLGRTENAVEFVVYHDEQQKRVRFLARPGQSSEPAKEAGPDELPEAAKLR